MLRTEIKTNPILEDSMSDVADAVIDQRSSVNEAVLVDGKLRIRSERIQRLVDFLNKVDDNCTQ